MTVRVLLVDAHDEARKSLVRRLKSDGRIEVVADVPTVAGAGVAVRGSPCDLALMNIQSHDNESIARCQELRRLTGIPLVVLTSFMTVKHWRALRQAGAAEYLLKHADSQLLCSAIVQLADRHGTATGAAREVDKRAMNEERADDGERSSLLRGSEEHEALLGAMHQLEEVLSSL